MTNHSEVRKNQLNKKEDRSIPSVLFGMLGTLMILAVLLISIPASLPRLMGYEIFNIVSGSMEPNIPVGSAIYVKTADFQSIQVNDVIAFEVEGAVVAHRVVEVDSDKEQFITKGDANLASDMNPVFFANVIGKVDFHIPYLGNLMLLFTTGEGKTNIILFLVAGVLFTVFSSLLKKQKKALLNAGEKDEEIEDGLNQELTKQEPDYSSIRKKLRIVRIIGLVVLVAFIGVAGYLGKNFYQYYAEKKYDEQASELFTEKTDTSKIRKEQQVLSNVEEGKKKDPYTCPIQVDFDSLLQVNSDIIGWIYCEDTVINYPICYTDNNDFYLKHAYDKTSKRSGSIFMETLNLPDFSDRNSVLYGHHMKNKTMFATISYWGQQEYYEEHPFMWLFTKDGTYRVDLVSGFYTNALSEVYTVYGVNGPGFDEYISKMLKRSDFEVDFDYLDDEKESHLVKEEKERYIILSTCEYTSENARYVLFGRLQKMK